MDHKLSNQEKEQIREVILNDFSSVMTSPGSLAGKFILIAVGIEFLGACLDKQHMKATARSEKRFNMAITRLFPKKYHHFVKKDSIPNLYFDFRCPIIHQFKPGSSIFLSSLVTEQKPNFQHLSYHADGSLILVAEELYLDLASAANALI